MVRLRKCSIISYICMLLLFLAMYVRTKNCAHIAGAVVLDQSTHRISSTEQAYLIFVIFFTRANFLENKIYTEKRHFFALNL